MRNRRRSMAEKCLSVLLAAAIVVTMINWPLLKQDGSDVAEAAGLDEVIELPVEIYDFYQDTLLFEYINELAFELGLVAGYQNQWYTLASVSEDVRLDVGSGAYPLGSENAGALIGIGGTYASQKTATSTLRLIMKELVEPKLGQDGNPVYSQKTIEFVGRAIQKMLSQNTSNLPAEKRAIIEDLRKKTMEEVTSVEVTGVEVTGAVLKVGDTYTLTATVLPDNATDKTVTWTSSDSTIASVDPATGVVTAHRAGEVTITATAGNGISGSCTVTVEERGDNTNKGTLRISKSSDTSATVTLSELGSDYLDKQVMLAYRVYESQGGSVIVKEQGATAMAGTGDLRTLEITDLADGQYVVAFYQFAGTDPEGTYENPNAVYIHSAAAVEEVKVSVTADKTVLNGVGDYTDIKATVTGTDNTGVAWSVVSGNDKIVVGADGRVSVTAGATNGTAVVRATSLADSTKYAEITFTVEIAAATEVTVNPTALDMPVLSVDKVTASVSDGGSVTWSSGNPSVAAVDKNGTVTAVGAGNTTIIATAADGTTASIPVTVTQPVFSYVLDQATGVVTVKASGIPAKAAVMAPYAIGGVNNGEVLTLSDPDGDGTYTADYRLSDGQFITWKYNITTATSGSTDYYQDGTTTSTDKWWYCQYNAGQTSDDTKLDLSDKGTDNVYRGDFTHLSDETDSLRLIGASGQIFVPASTGKYITIEVTVEKDTNHLDFINVFRANEQKGNIDASGMRMTEGTDEQGNTVYTITVDNTQASDTLKYMGLYFENNLSETTDTTADKSKTHILSVVYSERDTISGSAAEDEKYLDLSTDSKSINYSQNLAASEGNDGSRLVIDATATQGNIWIPVTNGATEMEITINVANYGADADAAGKLFRIEYYKQNATKGNIGEAVTVVTPDKGTNTYTVKVTGLNEGEAVSYVGLNLIFHAFSGNVVINSVSYKETNPSAYSARMSATDSADADTVAVNAAGDVVYSMAFDGVDGYDEGTYFGPYEYWGYTYDSILRNVNGSLKLSIADNNHNGAWESAVFNVTPGTDYTIAFDATGNSSGQIFKAFFFDGGTLIDNSDALFTGNNRVVLNSGKASAVKLVLFIDSQTVGDGYIDNITVAENKTTVSNTYRLGSYEESRAKFGSVSNMEPAGTGFSAENGYAQITTCIDYAYYVLNHLYSGDSGIGNDSLIATGNAALPYLSKKTDVYDKLILKPVIDENGRVTYVFLANYDLTSVSVYNNGTEDVYNFPVIYDTAARTITNDTASGVKNYSSSVADAAQKGFFPIDSGLYRDTEGNYLGTDTHSDTLGEDHNYHYAMKSSGKFVYSKEDNLYFKFTGDDDVYLFINGQLVMDIGGAHQAYSDTVYLNDVAGGLGLEEGAITSFDFFYLERHTDDANISINSNIKLLNPAFSLNIEAKKHEDNSVIPNGTEGLPIGIAVDYTYTIENTDESDLRNFILTDGLGNVFTSSNLTYGPGVTANMLTVYKYDKNGNQDAAYSKTNLTQLFTDGIKSGERIVIVITGYSASGTVDNILKVTATGQKITGSMDSSEVEITNTVEHLLKTAAPSDTEIFYAQKDRERSVFLEYYNPMTAQVNEYTVAVYDKDRQYIGSLKDGQKEDGTALGMSTVGGGTVYITEKMLKDATFYDSSKEQVEFYYEVYSITGSRTGENLHHVIGYLYSTQDDVYVLDYGLPVELNDDTYGSGIFQTDVYTNTSNSVEMAKAFVGIRKDENGLAHVHVNEVYNQYTETHVESQAGVLNVTQKEKFANYVSGGATQANTANNLHMNYTPTSFMTDIQKYEYCVVMYEKGTDYTAAAINTQAANRVLYMDANVRILPATVVYYDDNFGDITYSGNVTANTTASSNIVQTNDADSVYGYDSLAYTNEYRDSANGCTVLAYDAANPGKATFEFTGTGIDIIGRLSSDSGTVTAKIYDWADGKWKLSKFAVVDNYCQLDVLYQIPVLSITGLNRENRHKAVISVYLGSDVIGDSHRGLFYMDGVRIYNPLTTGAVNSSDVSVSAVYGAEYNAFVYNIKDLITTVDNKMTKMSLSSSTEIVVDGNITGYTQGVTLIDSWVNNGNTLESMDADRALELYGAYGPNNEVYLTGGNAVSFIVTKDGSWSENGSTIQIEAKTITEGSVPTAIEIVKPANGERQVITVNSGAAKYYEIPLDYCQEIQYNGVKAYWIVLRAGESATGDNILSLSNLKTQGYTMQYVDSDKIVCRQQESAETGNSSSLTTTVQDDEQAAVLLKKIAGIHVELW